MHRMDTVFEMIGRSETSGSIARILGLSVKTVETYRDNIKRKLELESAAALAVAAFAWKRGDFLPSPEGSTGAPRSA